jgi:hypothetical protein
MFRAVLHKNVYLCFGAMHGGEYLLSTEATHKHSTRLEEINAQKGDWTPLRGIGLTEATSVLNTNLVAGTASLWLQGNQFVVNRHATAKHLEELEQLNFGHA